MSSKLAFALVLYYVLGIISSSSVSLIDNGYSDIVVKISGNVAEDSQIIYKLKSGFEDASKLLYKATKRHTYFREVTVVVPKAWSSNQQYGSVAAGFGENADVIIDTPSSNKGDIPFTQGMMGCGQGGQFIQLTPNLVKSSSSLGFGSLGKVLVHEWAHYRWGVFDEYPVAGLNPDDTVERFYLDNGTWKPVRCSEQIEGDVLVDCNDYTTECYIGDTGAPHPFCNFCIRLPNRATGSLMSFQWVDSIVDFCDTGNNATNLNRHNEKAPNDQNRYCGGKSVWEVLRQHNDFTGAPGADNLNTEPVIKIVQETSEKMALLLDISGSMANSIGAFTRIERLVDVVSNFILYTIPTGSNLAIITFSNDANVQLPMTTIANVAIRNEIVKNLTLTPSGRTAIGLAFLEGLNILKSTGTISPGSKLILVTDGQENVQPFISKIKDQVVSSGVIVHTLAMGSSADEQIGAISKDTGGKAYYFTESVNSSALKDVFIESMSGEARPVEIQSTSVRIAGASSVSGNFIIDSTVGRDTLVLLSVDNPRNSSLTVKSPNGTVYKGLDTLDGSNTRSSLIWVRFPGEIPIGTYSYECSGNVQTDGTLVVQSATRLNSAPFSIKTWVQNDKFSYAESSKSYICSLVTRKNNAIINVTVNAFLENEGSDVNSLILKDNGLGFDLKENDGIYCGAILPSLIKQNGRINIRVVVSNKDKHGRELAGVPRNPVSAASPIKQDTQLQSIEVEAFQRVTQGGEIVVTGYTSSPLEDKIPPATITTLSLINIDHTTGNATVSWTAVGDDLDVGKASGYYIILGTDINKLRTDLSHGLTLPSGKPKAAGEKEVISIILRSQNITHFLCVRAVDDSNNIGDCSNILPLSIVTDPKWLPKLIQKKITPNDNDIIVITISSCIAFFFLLGILISLICLVSRKSKKDDILPIVKANVALSGSRINSRYLYKGNNSRLFDHHNTSYLESSHTSELRQPAMSSNSPRDPSHMYYAYDGRYAMPVVMPDYPL